MKGRAELNEVLEAAEQLVNGEAPETMKGAAHIEKMRRWRLRDALAKLADTPRKGFEPIVRCRVAIEHIGAAVGMLEPQSCAWLALHEAIDELWSVVEALEEFES